MVAVDASKRDAALAYARAGLYVFPCYEVMPDGRCACQASRAGPSACTPGKHPRITGGFTAATTNVNQIEAWWRQWPHANIGVALERSGLLGCDIDPRNGGDEVWRDVCARTGPLPDTWTNLTGGGGQQFYFRTPQGYRHTAGKNPFGPGVDIITNGYGIMPPSTHPSGKTYQWEIGYGPGDEGFPQPAPLPQSLERAFAESARGPADSPPRAGVAELLQGDVAEGARHTTFNSIIGWARNVMGQAEAEALLCAWNKDHCRPPYPDAELLAQIADFYARYPAPATATIEADEAPAPQRWTLIPGKELRRMDLPPVAWLVENMLPVGRYCVLSGESGLGKSWWALALALCAAKGIAFLGRAILPTRTLYIDEENGIQEAQRRLRALADGLGIPADSDLGVDFLIDESVKPGRAMDAAQLVALIKAGGYTLVITDSLIRFFEGNENHSDEVAAFHAAIDAIRRATGITWIMLQHLNKAGANGGLITPGDRVRGSSEFKAHADVHIQLRGTDGTGDIRVHVEKLRGGVKPADVVYRLDGNTMLDEPVRMVVLGSATAALGAEHAALVYALELLEKHGAMRVGDILDVLGKEHNVAKRTGELMLKNARRRNEIVVSHQVKNSVYLKRGPIRDD